MRYDLSNIFDNAHSLNSLHEFYLVGENVTVIVLEHYRVEAKVYLYIISHLG